MEDFNYLLRIRQQMGFSFGNELKRKVPNATKCLTWNDVKKSHNIDDQKLLIKFDDINGMVILLLMGLCGSVVIMVVELLSKDLVMEISSSILLERSML